MALTNEASRIHAAGGVLWDSTQDGVRIALIYRPACDNWSLPKGKLAEGEHPMAGAVREVEEETGVVGVPGPFLTSSTYTLPNPAGDLVKTVDYWAMRAVNPGAPFVPNEEIAERRWVSLEEARKLCSRPRDFAALDAFEALPRITGLVVFLRHAKAVAGVEFDGPDVARPLETRGRARAGYLVPLLALFQPARVVSASPLRCVKTVEPLAGAMGAEVEGDAVFDAEAHFRNPERAAVRLAELAKGGDAVVVCSQLPVIADSLALLADTSGLSVPSVHTKPGEGWVLGFDGPTLVTCHRL
ncbi:8-oxo-dGTP diphosphatase [Actinorhabdospora filicis]|uniref:8-oxo-dGTP diphosphatase n=1 Tax=Actinorhabdospora filicis TaxID=1785913 RepID=A0A9W6SQA2_9ACTN|nr:NUDIX hydrolase [Actinorhabdospora filicis]GLZ79907.1 8-oxo-dGTP diphosphatase [Actinorhabdospora filicis]